MAKIEINERDAFYVRALMSRGYSELVTFLSSMKKLMDSPEWLDVPGSIRDSVRGACLHAEQLRSEAAEMVSHLPEQIQFQRDWVPLDTAPHYNLYAGSVVDGEIL